MALSLSIINAAIEIAKTYHNGQVRKSNGEPYFNHPKRVSKIIFDYPEHIEQLSVATRERSSPNIKQTESALHKRSLFYKGNILSSLKSTSMNHPQLNSIHDTLVLEASAYLHDVLEDGKIYDEATKTNEATSGCAAQAKPVGRTYTTEQMRETFEDEITDTVIQLTNDASLPREEQKGNQVKDVEHYNKYARIVKLADMIDNLSGLLNGDIPKEWDFDRVERYFYHKARVLGSYTENDDVWHPLRKIININGDISTIMNSDNTSGLFSTESYSVTIKFNIPNIETVRLINLWKLERYLYRNCKNIIDTFFENNTFRCMFCSRIEDHMFTWYENDGNKSTCYPCMQEHPEVGNHSFVCEGLRHYYPPYKYEGKTVCERCISGIKLVNEVPESTRLTDEEWKKYKSAFGAYEVFSGEDK